jgi:hypothetical protein
MVDRQQNVSDTRMSGEWFQGANELSAARKFVMPFATFIMNQKQRVSADVNIMTSKTATIEEKARAANSIAGAMIEIGVFTMVKAANLSVMVYLASKLAGDDDDEAKARAKEKWDESFGPKLFGQMAVELLPAPPVFDDAMNQFVINPLANAMGYEGKLNYVDENKSSIEVLLGGFMTSVDRAVKPIDMFEEAKSGKFEMKNRYTGEMETKYYLPKDKEMMKTVAELAWSSWLLTEDGIRIAERAMNDARYRAMSEKEYLKYMAESSGDYEEYDAYRRQKKEESREGRSERKEAKAKKEAKRQERM